MLFLLLQNIRLRVQEWRTRTRAEYLSAKWLEVWDRK